MCVPHTLLVLREFKFAVTFEVGFEYGIKQIFNKYIMNNYFGLIQNEINITYYLWIYY